MPDRGRPGSAAEGPSALRHSPTARLRRDQRCVSRNGPGTGWRAVGTKRKAAVTERHWIRPPSQVVSEQMLEDRFRPQAATGRQSVALDDIRTNLTCKQGVTPDLACHSSIQSVVAALQLLTPIPHHPLAGGVCNSLVASSLVLSCGHTFCGSCIFELLNDKPACPTCAVSGPRTPPRCPPLSQTGTSSESCALPTRLAYAPSPSAAWLWTAWWRPFSSSCLRTSSRPTGHAWRRASQPPTS